jgi:hypothetical protein
VAASHKAERKVEAIYSNIDLIGARASLWRAGPSLDTNYGRLHDHN